METKSFIYFSFLFYTLPFPLSFKHTFSVVSRASAEMQGGPLFPTSEVSALVGLEDAERELVSRLLDGTEENLSVISLVSEEAVGKTALARHVIKRLDIRQHFQCCLWVHVRKEFAYKDLLLIILKQIPICLLKDIELMSEKELRQNWFSRL